MARVRVRTRKPEDFRMISDLVPPEDRKKFSETELNSRIRFIEQGDEKSLQLLELDYLPNAAIDIHAHREDEIIYVVAGEMHIGNRMLGPGATVFIAGHTLYGFKAGPEGLRMLNFRPRSDLTFITKDEFRNRSRGESPSEAAPESGNAVRK